MRFTHSLLPLASLPLWPFVAAVDPLVDLGYTKLQGAAQAIGVTQWLGVRFAAPPLGKLRFAAPADPLPTNGTVADATKFGPICLPRSASDFTMQPNRRFTVSEDCLFLNIFAPSNATAQSNLPVMYFIQGGGFQSLSNANFNGSDLASFGNMVVVQVNYRVGPFGFLQSKEVQTAGSLNNGLKDQIQGLKWLQQHVAAFGGDPNHIVAAGDSAGATSIGLLLSAWADVDPSQALIKGAIMESVSVATVRTIDQGQEQYNCLLNATSCTRSTDTLSCLRQTNASLLQTENCQFNPHLDGDLVRGPMLARFDQGLYLRIPTIAGTCSDEGTKNVPVTTDTAADALTFINNQASGSLGNSSLVLLNTTYLNVAQPVFASSGQQQPTSPGRLWRQLSIAFGDFRAHCITARLQNSQARDGVKTFNYRFAVRDAEQESLGFGAYHTVELNAVFGPNNTDGAPPKSYVSPNENAAIVPTTMAYWASFVRSLDPNAFRQAEAPDWTPWTGPDGRQRLRFATGDTAMETMDLGQRGNCELLDPMLPAIESPQPQGVVVELNAPGRSLSSTWVRTSNLDGGEGEDGTGQGNGLNSQVGGATGSGSSSSSASTKSGTQGFVQQVNGGEAMAGARLSGLGLAVVALASFLLV